MYVPHMYVCCVLSPLTSYILHISCTCYRYILHRYVMYTSKYTPPIFLHNLEVHVLSATQFEISRSCAHPATPTQQLYLLLLPGTYTEKSQDHLFFLHFNREHIKTQRPKYFVNSIGNDLFVHGSIDQDTDAPDNQSIRLHPIMLFLNVHHPRFQHDGFHHLFNVVVRVRVHGCTIQQYISRSHKNGKDRRQNESAGRPRQHDVKPRSTAYIERRKEIPHHQTNASDQITKRHGQNQVQTGRMTAGTAAAAGTAATMSFS